MSAFRMYLRHNKFLIKLTLLFFLSMVGYNPALAQQRLPTNAQTEISTGSIPVTYVTPEEAEQIMQQAQNRGYFIQEGTVQQLADLEEQKQPTPKDKTKTDETKTDETKDIKENQKPCTDNENDQQDNPELKDARTEQKANAKDDNNQPQSKECVKEQEDKTKQKTGEPAKPMAVPFPEPQPVPQPVPVPPPPPPQPQPTVQTNIGIQADIGYGHGGRGGDSGKVFFILAGIMVIAAFIVYTGKYIADLASGKDFKTWWEFIFTNTYLSTNSGQHGRLNGLKIATGFVSSDLIQIALVGEFGNTDIDVILDEYSSTPTSLNYSASYWMLGASARLHLSDKLVNASYLYLDFMGGQTSEGSADTIGMARLGASFGINDYVRLGASIGAHYIGLNEDEGFVNHGDNYWTTLGFEMGVKF